jgi:glycosyltransferase involved in cell wall biosynthesis
MDRVMKKKISCHIITYNQKDYISQCIEGVLMQKTNFSFEIIIGDDNSTDGTREILKKYARKYPDVIKLNLRQVRGIGIPGKQNFLTTLELCTGEYISLCDGDDYWTDSLKLQKQVDFLEANPDYVLCFHQVSILNTNGEIEDDFITKVPENYETIETLARLGNYIHTPSAVFRNVIKKLPFEFEWSPIGDYFLYIILAQHGKLKYLEEKMAVYRYGIGLYSSESNTNILIMLNKQFACLLSYLKDDNLKKIILDRNFLLINSFNTHFHSKYTSDDYIIKYKSLKSILKILTDKIIRWIAK